jgi:hypothetical protein
LLTAILLALIAAAPASGDVGIERTSSRAGAPGDTVTVTLGCGFCYPPCKGAPGHREPSPCMLGTKAQPPVSFPISLVPIGKAPQPFSCAPNALCSPETAAPPHRAPFRYLGEALPPSAEQPQTGHVPPPRYRLDFTVPELAPGTYTYVIYCDVCQSGSGGILIADPRARPWRLELRAPRPGATITG